MPWHRPVVTNLATILMIAAAGGASSATMTDPRDRETYRLVQLGGLLWTAENLRHGVPGSTCYEYRADNCRRLGRLYVLDVARAACPPGWRLPSDLEWMALEQDRGISMT